MGLAPVEDALCLEPGFQGFLARALSQEEAGDDRDDDAAAAAREEESCKLRSKAAFVLKVGGWVSQRERERERWRKYILSSEDVRARCGTVRAGSTQV